jgi:hypothetical protein
MSLTFEVRLDRTCGAVVKVTFEGRSFETFAKQSVVVYVGLTAVPWYFVRFKNFW